MTILVTGGAGFIGANFVRDWLAQSQELVVNLDKLTYAGNLKNLADIKADARHVFVQGDIGDRGVVDSLLANHKPRAVLNFAAESHVDRSIEGPRTFVDTNIVGTFSLLEASNKYVRTLSEGDRRGFRFLQVSTDEVYGSLGADDPAFTETTPYAPNSPYSASKAAADHLVRSYFHTFDLPTLITNCSNNYGPFQFPEKLIPVMIQRALSGQPIPIYGDGQNVRDWLYVEDHADALLLVLEKGDLGRSYNIGGENEARNIDLVKTICSILDQKRPKDTPYADQITFVQDRAGHDLRYAIDPSRIRDELGWRPSVTVEEGLERTVQWYLDNEDWWRALQNRDGVGQRLGTNG